MAIVTTPLGASYVLRTMTFVARRPTAEVLAVLLDHLIGLSHHVPGFPLLVTVMTPEEFQQYYPRLLGWIDTTLRAHSANARTVTSRGFPRLPLYFTADTLASAKVVLADQLPLPPLSSWGLTRFADFERGTFDGVTYMNFIFIKRNEQRNEAIHFHELIHVVQWRILGPEQFIRLYAEGLERFGYRDSPLEVMAYDAEVEFTANDVFNAEKMVAHKLG